MIRKLTKLLVNPQKYVPFMVRLAQQQVCSLFQNSSFYMQGQMDINPKSRWYSGDFVKLTGGYYPTTTSEGREICNLEPWDNVRRDMLILQLRTIAEKEIAGDIAEVGVYKGKTARLIHHFMPEKKLHLFDTFEGFTEKGVKAESAATNLNVSTAYFMDTSLGEVKRCVDHKNSNVSYYPGYFPESIPQDFAENRFSFVHLDADLYEPILEGLKFFYPLTNKMGMIVVHDYNAWPGARKAVDEYFADKPELPIPMPDKSGSVLVVKQ